MFYSFVRGLAAFIIWVVNGRYDIINKEKLPEGNYVLVGPHRTIWDPVYFALATWPKRFTFMAKIELFKNPILGFILRHGNAFPVDRANPGPSVIKIPVNALKKTDLSLIMFPSGSRHSNEMKGGALMIAKMAGVPVVPAVYQGPLTLGGLFKHQKVTIAYGDPIIIDKKLKLNDENIATFGNQLTAAFETIDQQINPDFKYVDQHPEKTEEFMKAE
ncbi:MAG: 1-acyl-sn-glycerol-3-phosphate acyltransferase [Lactobacillaceae bacterium]|jgi:1-acyl-sn-glycerol-3-phosphate acyltransferase|nr:1-acyl-sn-glycerol-3-phosphate acyltransferase [Lactobacillaceae bacterium]